MQILMQRRQSKVVIHISENKACMPYLHRYQDYAIRRVMQLPFNTHSKRPSFQEFATRTRKGRRRSAQLLNKSTM